MRWQKGEETQVVCETTLKYTNYLRPKSKVIGVNYQFVWHQSCQVKPCTEMGHLIWVYTGSWTSCPGSITNLQVILKEIIYKIISLKA